MLAWIDGLSPGPGESSARISFTVLAPVVIEGMPKEGEVAFRFIPKPEMRADPSSVAAFKSQIRHVIEPLVSFERERFEALTEPEAGGG